MVSHPLARTDSTVKGEQAELQGEALAGQERILIADDDPIALRSLEHCLAGAGYTTVSVSNGQEALDALDADIQVALIDLYMPVMTGLECVQALRKQQRDVQVIVVSGEGQIKDAVSAMKAGAFEYVTKPFDSEELLVLVRQASRHARLNRNNRELLEAVGHSQTATDFATASPASVELLESIGKLSGIDSNILITGESGTGKSTIARMIHQRGPRSNGPFVAVNCAALPKDLIESELFGHAKGAFTGATNDRPGRVEIADGGTLFLDEIGDLPLELQPKLLTFLQDHTVQRIGCNKVNTVDVRVIAATHQDLRTMCQDKLFREDLFYRLNVLEIFAPPLRARVEDIPDLCANVLARISHRRQSNSFEIAPDAIELLGTHSWPGNIRELENVLERATAFCDDCRITVGDIRISESPRASDDDKASGLNQAISLAGQTLAELEKRAIQDTLTACNGNKAQSARELGISEKSIYNKIKRHSIMSPPATNRGASDQ